ncbi:diaminopimelate epimerase [Acidobacteria bacterium AH-259-O06]|nr:diaminopimelate epimerase [Acidobacteria bacterium AH-259-O06]
MISAAKYHSWGNDFLIVSFAEVQEEHYSALSKAICHRQFGVGADGCVFVGSSSKGQFHIRIFNRDGTEAGMSGNGARCACAYLHHHGLAEGPKIPLHTRSGLKVHILLEQWDWSWKYKSLMGAPALEPAAIPFQAPSALETVEEYPLEVHGQTVLITALSVGNPHCVVFVEEFPQAEDLERLGSALEVHSYFPDRANVSFVRVKEHHQLEIKMWERGVGPTYSSGTCSCAAAVAAVRAGKVESPVEVHTDTGSQLVEWNPGGEIVLTGKAEFIAEVKFQWNQHV